MDFFYPFFALCGFLLIFVIILFVTMGLWYRYVDNNVRGCPECETRGSGYIINTEVLNSSSHVERKGLRRYRITEEHLVDTYQCSNCHHEWTRTLNQKTRMPIKSF